MTSELPSGHYYQIKAVLYQSGSWVENAWAGHWNTPPLVLLDASNYTFSSNQIAKGADISWMTEMESDGIIWKDNEMNTRDLFPLLKEYDLNVVRLRVWVDPDNSPANGWCDIEDMVTKAKLAQAEGMDIMICTHYSDWWADPGKQNKPAGWTSMTVSQLETAVYNHTIDILTALQNEGITPKWVQIGNETDDGMLWPTGKAYLNGFSSYAKFIDAGSNAVKTFNSNIETILHLSNGNDNNLYRWNIDGLINSGFDFSRIDIIGMSLYPQENNWISMVDDAYMNMLDMQSRYNKDVMLVEVGYPNERPDISFQFLIYMIEKTKLAGGLGVLYWEPIAHSNFNSYPKGAWDNDGSPSIAMDAFLNSSTLSNSDFSGMNETKNVFKIIPNSSSDFIQLTSKHTSILSIEFFDLNGRLLKSIKEGNLQKKINISGLSSGVYFIRINKQYVSRFIKK